MSRSRVIIGMFLQQNCFKTNFFRALDGIFQDPNFDVKVLVNFMAMQYLIGNDDFIGGLTKQLTKQLKSKKFTLHQEDFDEDKQICVAQAQGL